MVAEPTWIWEAEGSERDPLTLGAGDLRVEDSIRIVQHEHGPFGT